jgi:GNAT superfamily N-acetyltransferase
MGEQVAYARAVTDGVTFAWLCDVFVDKSVRGLEIGVALVAAAAKELDSLGLKRIVLITADAHSLYERFGFAPVDSPESWMVKIRADADVTSHRAPSDLQ